jgi:hexosaminidase
MSPTSHCYFDYYQSRHPDEPLAIGGYLPLEKVYSYEPIPSELTAEEARHILGAQGNVWTEYMPTTEQVEYMAFPRALAMAEVQWSPAEKKDFEFFQDRLARYLPRLPVNYADHLFDIEYELNGTNLSLSNRNGRQMWYQLDGGTPALYETPLSISKNTRIRAWKAGPDGEPKGRLLDLDFHAHAGFGKKAAWKESPHPNYGLGSAASLTNGLLGSDDRFGDGEWKGWWGKDVELTVDLGKSMLIGASQIRFFQSPGQWIYLPREVEVWFSKDGNQYDLVTRKSLPHDYNGRVLTLDLELPPTQGRYWKLKVQRYGAIPPGAQGAGQEAWVFLDEWLLR